MQKKLNRLSDQVKGTDYKLTRKAWLVEKRKLFKQIENKKQKKQTKNVIDDLIQHCDYNIINIITYTRKNRRRTWDVEDRR